MGCTLRKSAVHPDLSSKGSGLSTKARSDHSMDPATCVGSATPTSPSTTASNSTNRPGIAWHTFSSSKCLSQDMEEMKQVDEDDCCGGDGGQRPQVTETHEEECQLDHDHEDISNDQYQTQEQPLRLEVAEEPDPQRGDDRVHPSTSTSDGDGAPRAWHPAYRDEDVLCYEAEEIDDDCELPGR